jgi:succinyl-CoA synthetase beta subunit
MRLLADFGLVLTPAVPARSAAEAATIAEAMGFPVVAKLSSAQVLHKSDIGGVQVNLQTRADVIAAFEQLTDSAREKGLGFDSVRIQPMVPGGVETAIGIAHDGLFGSLVGFGSGGVDIEALDDMHFRVTPMDDSDVKELMAEPRIARLLRERRGRPPADTAALFDLLARVSRLAEEVPEVLELDFNPVLVRPAGQGCHIVDVRVRVGSVSKPQGRGEPFRGTLRDERVR